MSLTGVAGACPSCGAPLVFGGASSLAAVCSYCRSAVARRGVELELLGQVPDLVATDTRLALGVGGSVEGHGFHVLGHLQLGRPDPREPERLDATWDEWYVAFDDGTWGWLAEAQGRLHLTRPVERAPTARWQDLAPGQRLRQPGLGELAVEEVGEARFLAAAGELPFAPRTGATYRYADLSAASGRFFTFDYGDPTEGGEGQVFFGRRLGYEEAGLADRRPAPPVAGAEGDALACPHCGGPLSLRSKESVTLTCPSCRSLLDRKDGAKLRVVEYLARREPPPIPLGSRGTLDGEAAEVLGWVRRSTVADGVTYFWDEYLLHGPSGYRWLAEGDGQWHLLSPIEGGRVEPLADLACRVDGERFRHFQSGTATYVDLQGEFYWRVRVGGEVETADFVAPPRMLSREIDDREEAWTWGRWIAADEVWRAFSLPGAPPPSSIVGAAQPNPWAARARSAWRVGGVALLALLVLAEVVDLTLPREKVLAVDVLLAAAGDSAVFVSEPFELTSGHQAVEVRASAACEQSWVGLDIALINDDTGDSEAVGIDLSYYHGYDDGESWAEGSRTGRETIGGVRRGRYVLRVEPQFGHDGAGTVPETAHVELVRGPFLMAPLVLALVALLVWPLWTLVRRGAFEKRRWDNSDHPAGGSS